MNTNQPTNQPTNPPNAEVILKRYRKETSSSDESSTSVLSGDNWLKLQSIVRRTVKDQGSKDVKKLRRSLHHISAQNSILRGEIRGLKEALLVKKRHQKKSYTLQRPSTPEYHGGFTLWSPKRVQRAKDDEVIRQQQKQQDQLQKAERSYLKEQARLYKLQEAQEKRVERERESKRRRRRSGLQS
jgi:hypothetical protein